MTIVRDMTNELGNIYEKRRANDNIDYINLRDDNTTLYRQAQLNNDMFLRTQFLNSILKLLLIFLSLLILIGFLNSIGIPMSITIIPIIIIFVVCATIFLIRMKELNNYHKLQFRRLKSLGYPKINKENQDKHGVPINEDKNQCNL